jgi:DNA-directed RNA polymerase subunit RPC12/RpoP
MVVKVYKCKRCQHEWAGRKPEKPLTCPKCRSAYWNTERTRTSKLGGIIEGAIIVTAINKMKNAGIDIDNNADRE